VGSLRRIRLALLALAAVLCVGTLGYVVLGFSVLDAVYQTVTTVTTVGFREVKPLGAAGQIFTIALILVGAGTALYTFGVLLEGLIEGQLRSHLEGRRMERDINRMSHHIIICGWGRVGRASAEYLTATGESIVVVDRDRARLDDCRHACVIGDVTDDSVLVAAGVARARALIAAVDTDADNVYMTLSSRALNPDLVIIARARTEASKSKLVRAGADRAVNPQLIGGRRMAAFALQPHVAEFLDVVMHDETLEFRIEQVEVPADSPLIGRSLREAGLSDITGTILLAIRPSHSGPFQPNPSSDTRLAPHTILIVVGTPAQLDCLRRHCCAVGTAP
jgi:voltage-gated potassium channel